MWGEPADEQVLPSKARRGEMPLLGNRRKMTITPIANTILGGEKAWSLKEVHEQSPTNSGFHRYQIITVIRGGVIAEFRKDMGLAKKFKKARQINIPSLMEHTVDELMDLADNLRYEQPKDEFDIREILGLYPFKSTDAWENKHAV